MHSNQLVLFISKCPEEYTGVKHIEMPESGGSMGRSPSCSVSLTDHNRFISGTHCLISVYGDTYYISDVSTNGTMVNGNKTLKNQPVAIVDGDIISLGQYEIGVSLEHVTSTQDIAADIAPERVSNDPLVSLGDAVVEEEEKVGALEDLFMETKQDDIDCHDPVAHLNFSMQRDDDYLIRDDEHPEPEQPKTVESTRQVVDDSFSIYSEFDQPSLIPEDWMATETKSNASINGSLGIEVENGTPHREDIVSEETVQPQTTILDRAVQRQHRAPNSTEAIVEHTATGSKWEEMTQSFTPSSQTNQPLQMPAVEPTINSTTKEQAGIEATACSQDIAQAFFDGLGIRNPELMTNEAQLFKQMGTCLRLCIDNLQKELHEVESLKEEQSTSESNSNIAELMLTLNSQHLLAPNELVEQMLDELNDHQVTFNKALNELILEQSETNDPVAFANKVASQSLFSTKSKLWGEYLDFYSNNRRLLNETSLKGLIKKNYNKVIKGNHA
ncbi:type VI secretion system-associated FHA domain protein [Vibrio diabolicus]|uniref:type VI secretion system-associated FHA domain protein n=1 Tax=Vibrio diabolicus TaxID=50719 RepID=UPI0035A8E90F